MPEWDNKHTFEEALLYRDKDFIESGDDCMSPTEVDGLEHIKELFKIALEVLDKREKQIIKMTYGIDCNPRKIDAIAKEIGISKERIKQLQTIAERKARYHLERKGVYSIH